MALALLRRFPVIAREGQALRAQLAKAEQEAEALRKGYDEQRNENIRLLDRVEDMLRDRTELWKLTREALAEERTAYQMHINVQWQQRGGGIPYPDQPHIPPADPNQRAAAGRERIQADDLIASKTRDYVRGLTARTR